MSQLLKQNAYRILGLDSSVETKDVLRRAKEIDHRLKIDDTPAYDIDINISTSSRSESAVKDAVQRLQNQKQKIQESFFWIRIVDDIDEQALKSIAKQDFVNAIRTWQNAAEGTTIKALFYKKNLAVLLGLLLLEENNHAYLRDSLALWQELLGSEKLWNSFIKDYEKRNEDVSKDFITKFKSQATNLLADFYTDLHELHKDSSYINEFKSAFSVRGEKMEKTILNPAFQTINTIVEGLEAMNISEDGVFDDQEKAQVKKFVGDLKTELNKLIELGLYDDSKTKVMRDRAADALRSIVLDIHNNLDDLPTAEQLLKIALQFVGTAGMKQKLEQDLDTFENNKKFTAAIAPILELMQEKKFTEAIALIEKMKIERKDEADFVQAMDVKKKEAVTLLALVEFADGKKFFDENKFDEAAPKLQKAASTIYDHIDIFDVNKEVIDSWLDTIKHNVRILTSDNVKEIDEIHNKMLTQVDDAFENRYEQIAVKLLINSYYYIGLGEVIKKKKTSNLFQGVMGWIIWIAIILIIGAIFG